MFSTVYWVFKLLINEKKFLFKGVWCHLIYFKIQEVTLHELKTPSTRCYTLECRGLQDVSSNETSYYHATDGVFVGKCSNGCLKWLSVVACLNRRRVDPVNRGSALVRREGEAGVSMDDAL